MISFNDFIQKSSNRKSLYGYRLDDIVGKCLSMNDGDRIGLNEATDIVYSSTSLAETKRRYDECEYISEGYFKTFPTEKLVKSLVKAVQDVFKTHVAVTWEGRNMSGVSGYAKNAVEMNVFGKPGEDGISDIVNCEIYVENENRVPVEKLVRVLADEGIYCGYDYVAHFVNAENEDFIVYSVVFEARHTKPVIPENRILYHVAPTSIKDRILASGLIPKSKSMNHGVEMKHPARVYLFTVDLPDRSLKQFMRTARKKSTYFKDGQTRSEYAYCLFSVDLDKIGKIKLFRDGLFRSPSENPIAVYTYDNIPPDAIRFVREIK